MNLWQWQMYGLLVYCYRTQLVMKSAPARCAIWNGIHRFCHICRFHHLYRYFKRLSYSTKNVSAKIKESGQGLCNPSIPFTKHKVNHKIIRYR